MQVYCSTHASAAITANAHPHASVTSHQRSVSGPSGARLELLEAGPDRGEALDAGGVTGGPKVARRSAM